MCLNEMVGGHIKRGAKESRRACGVESSQLGANMLERNELTKTKTYPWVWRLTYVDPGLVSAAVTPLMVSCFSTWASEICNEFDSEPDAGTGACAGI